MDYFSLDIEGMEYKVIKTLDLKTTATNILVFGIEINEGSRNNTGQYLQNNGYDFAGTLRDIDDFYIRGNI